MPHATKIKLGAPGSDKIRQLFGNVTLHTLPSDEEYKFSFKFDCNLHKVKWILGKLKLFQ